ncbi:MAG TPA: polymer-forming cytoskeletal protein [Verrucomicrobiae bacterium]|nr:polymer-forming cytoskeletal protein [Verrucomicrobiae bacterium]
MNARIALVSSIFFAAVMLCAQPASARVQSVYHGGTYVGSVIVEPGQIVDGDLTVLFGDATIEGTVDGDVNVVGGTLYERPGATITGEVNTVGGEVAQSLIPWAPTDAIRTATSVDSRMLWRIATDVLVVLFFLIFPVRTRIALDRLERHPGLAVVAGLIGWVAVLPLALLLCISLILIPLVPVEGVLLIAGVFLGKAALSLLVGRRMCEVINPAATPSPFAALIVGLALLTLAELVPFVGILVTLFIGLVGLGAAILSFVGDHLIAPPGVAGSGQAPPAPIGGPPMPVA